MVSIPQGRRARRTFTAGAAAVAVVAALTGCASSGSGGPSGDSASVKSFDWQNYKGQTINVLMSEHPLSDSVKQGREAGIGDRFGLGRERLRLG